MHEGEPGGPFYRRPEAVAVNGGVRRVITAVLWMCSGIRGLGIAVEVHRFHLGAKRAGIWCYGRARRNGGGAARRRQGARSVLAGPRRRCHRRALACMRPRGEQRGIGRRRTVLSRRSVPCWPPREVPTPQKTPARAGQHATDARKRPSARVVLQTVGRGGEERAKCTVSMCLNL